MDNWKNQEKLNVIGFKPKLLKAFTLNNGESEWNYIRIACFIDFL